MGGVRASVGYLAVVRLVGCMAGGLCRLGVVLAGVSGLWCGRWVARRRGSVVRGLGRGGTWLWCDRRVAWRLDTVGVGLVWHGYLPAVRPIGRTMDMVGYIRRYAVAHKTCNR